MTIVDTDAALRFLRTAYEPDDWIALFLKSYQTGRTAQRVGPLSLFLEARIHCWLRAMNAQRLNVYVSVNAIRAGVRARTKESIGAVRHVFIEADEDGPQVIARVAGRPDLPPPSYVIHSSPNRVHLLWRACGFATMGVERLQKQLALQLAADPAATPCSQTTRLPGYMNHKYIPGHLVTVEYRDGQLRHSPQAFPSTLPPREPAHVEPRFPVSSLDAVQRARRYLAAIEPAVAGQHGDLRTFKACCRIVRGFALSDEEALALLTEWSDRCHPPWSEKELRDKIGRARKYGREPVGGLVMPREWR